MSDQMVREGDRQLDREDAYSERLKHKMKEFLPQVLSSPGDYDIDVDLGDNGDILDFLEVAMKPGGDIAGALAKLAREYNKLAEKAAEDLAHEAIRAEDEQGGYTE